MWETLMRINISSVLKILIDFVLMWIFIYYALKIVRNNNRTTQIFKGILLVIIARQIFVWLDLKAMGDFFSIIITWGFLSIIIIFAPEIRIVLENLGKNSFFAPINVLSKNEREHLSEQLIKAVKELSSTQTGALISIEQGNSLEDYIKTGVSIQSKITSELLCNIFYPKTPLHDGAVIIQGSKIACASAFFPPSNSNVPQSYGARHRAALGISEVTDCITIIVSEETGSISIAEKSHLRKIDFETFETFIKRAIFAPDEKRKLLKNSETNNYVNLEHQYFENIKEDNFNIKATYLDGEEVEIYYRPNKRRGHHL